MFGNKVLFIAFPVYLQNVMLLIVLVTDAFFLSFVSDEAVAGVGSTLPLIYNMVALIGVFSNSGTSFLSRSLGENNLEKFKTIFTVNLIIGLTLGTLLMVFQIYISDKFGTWCKLSPDANKASHLYLLYMAPMLLLDGFFLNFTSYLYAKEKPKATLYASASLAITNIILNTMLLFGMIPGTKIGPAEIANVTIVSQFPPIFIMGYCITKKLAFPFTEIFKFNKEIFKYVKKILFTGIPALLEPVSTNLSQLMVISFLSSITIFAVAANSYCNNILLLLTVASAKALSVGVQVQVGQLQGEKKYIESKKQLIKSLIYYLPYILIILLAINLLSRPLLSIFTDNQEVIGYCKTIFMFMLIIEPLKAINTIVFPTLRGSADVKKPVRFLIFSQWGLAVLVGWFLGIYLDLGIIGVYIGVMLDETVRAIFNILRWNSMRWVETIRQMA